MKVIIYDIDKNLIDICQKKLKDVDNIEMQWLPFDKVNADYIVTAGNSYGWMTGGIDLAVRNYFGQNIQDVIQQYIISGWHGYLPVGEIIDILTYDNTKPHLLYVPTMEIPKQIYYEDVYYALSKIFRYILQIPNSENKVLAICGLGTATGGVSAEDFAQAFKVTYNKLMVP